MAYLTTLREFQTRLLSLRDSLPMDCLLCRTRTPGGLCRHCRHAICASMLKADGRCARCDVLLVPGAVHCSDCRVLTPALERVVAAFDYAWPGELLIQRLKLRGQFSCVPVLAGLLAARCHALRAQADAPPLWCGNSAWVTAVPASRSALAARGYNPAGEVARALARRLALEWRPDLLQRAHERAGQKGLNRQARRRAVQGLYRCPVTGVAGKDILVVDDVMTTGSTLSAIADVLKDQGAAKVWGAVLARTPQRDTG
ncbi:MAG: ComF family protein [Alcaligenaceae bacterium]|nr:ComF family protein [Alcaligenaceae bacterium]